MSGLLCNYYASVDTDLHLIYRAIPSCNWFFTFRRLLRILSWSLLIQETAATALQQRDSLRIFHIETIWRTFTSCTCKFHSYWIRCGRRRWEAPGAGTEGINEGVLEQRNQENTVSSNNITSSVECSFSFGKSYHCMYMQEQLVSLLSACLLWISIHVCVSQYSLPFCTRCMLPCNCKRSYWSHHIWGTSIRTPHQAVAAISNSTKNMGTPATSKTGKKYL